MRHVGLPTGDNFKAKVPGLVNGGSAPPTLTAYTRATLHAITFRCHLPVCAWTGLRQGRRAAVKMASRFLTKRVGGISAANRDTSQTTFSMTLKLIPSGEFFF